MSSNRMIIIGDKETFILRMLVQKARNGGVECDFVKSSINEIYSGWGDASLVVIYIDDGEIIDDVEIRFIVERLLEKDSRLIIIGAPSDIQSVYERVPSQVVIATFAKPVDYGKYVRKIQDFFNKANSPDAMRSILVVDDDPQYLSLIRNWLKDQYRVSMANSGIQALKYLSLQKVDLVLLDFEMPVTSGPQVLEMLRSDPDTRSVPVIFLTGKSDRDSVMEVVALKPEGYFLKSIQKEELLMRLRDFFVLHG
ncbi:MAG: response regulator [Clostridia bacterium]|nr:response regulator [Clostridia bacterium]